MPYSGPRSYVDLRRRSARPRNAHRPVVIGHAAALDALERQAGDLLPQRYRLVIIEIDGRPEPFGVEAVTALLDGVGQQGPCELDGALLEVVAEAEVARHLEEGVVAGGDADLVDVRGADALLDAHRAIPRRRALAQEVRHELHHAGVDEQQIGVVEDHRGARHLGMARLHEVIEETLPDLVCLHVRSASSLWVVPRLPATIRPHYSTGRSYRA